MINRIKSYVQEQNMFAEGDYVVAGVSGGADSICLLCVLLELAADIPMTIHVVHVNHKIRSEAGEDAAYVERFCAERELPFTLVEADVEQLAADRHISTEEAGREVRYGAFYRVLEENRGKRRGRIAIAHNRNDCCETFLFHLFRGSGLKGLSGIPAVRAEIVRPLLHTDRAQIEQYLAQKGIHYCIDRTNLEDNYTRNRIRHHILQTAVTQVSSNATAHIQEACERIGGAYALIEDMTRTGYQQCIIQDKKGLHILEKPYSALHPTIQGYVLFEALSAAAGQRKDLEHVHVEQLQGLFSKQTGRSLNLPYDVVAVREYEGIRLEKGGKNTADAQQREYALIRTGELSTAKPAVVEWEDARLELRLFPAESVKTQEIPAKIYTKWFDYDKIKSDIVIRNRRAGDYFILDNDNRRKSLKAYFIDEKLPSEDRNHVYLVTEGQHCLWIIGRRISNWYKVSEDTKYILELKYSRRN